MRTRMRVAGIAIAVTAVGALAASTAPVGVPVIWTEAVSGPSSALPASAGPGPAASQRPAASKPPKGSLAAPTAISKLRQSASALTLSPRGTVTSVSGTSLAAGGADAFVHTYAAAFGLTDAHGLTRESNTALGGDTVTRYAQTAGGLPVFGGEIVVTAHGGSVRSAIATTSQAASSGRAAVTAAAAGPIALRAAEAQLKLTGLHVAVARQWQYDPTVIGAPGAARLRPTWQVDLADGQGPAASVLVDAVDGTVRLTLSTREEARNRLVCDLNSMRVDLNVRSNYACPTSPYLSPTRRAEGDAATGVTEIDNAYDLLGKVYDFYRDNLRVDSYDGHGAAIKATARACDLVYAGYQTCPYPNAFWEGTQFVFGEGFAVDDVVGHEFTHGVTEYSSHLIYAYQSGAINEAVSDIIGELFDQSFTGPGEVEQPWLIGEDLPIGAIRSMSNPAAYGQPSVVGGTGWDFSDFDNGGVHTNSGPANYAAYQIATQIGNAKSLQLWWRAMHLLPSGATYSTLYGALQTACLQLIGSYGITAADCAKLPPITANFLTSSASLGVRLADCATGVPETLYNEGFERANSWKASNATQWLTLPAQNAPYQYANTGHGSLNGWLTNTGYGNGTTATMPYSVGVPSAAAGKIFVRLSASALTQGSDTHAYVEMSVNGGGWKAATLGSATLYPLPLSPGYSDDKLDISSLAGTNVQFRVRITGTKSFDFYLDDVRIYQCVEKPAAPLAAAYLSGTTATVSVLSNYGVSGPYPSYITSGQTVARYEYKFIPPIPGAPASSTVPTITISNVEPGTYSVNIRTITNTGASSSWSSIRLSNSPPRNCQSPAYPVGWLMGGSLSPCTIIRVPH